MPLAPETPYSLGKPSSGVGGSLRVAPPTSSIVRRIDPGCTTYFFHRHTMNVTCQGIDCFFSTQGTVPFLYFGISSLLAWLVLLFQLVVLVHLVHTNAGQLMKKKVILSALVLLCLSVLFRALWFTLRASNIDNPTQHYINRFSVMFFFSGFTCYIQTWLVFLNKMNLAGFGPSGTVATGTTERRRKGTFATAWQWNIALNVVTWITIFSLSFAHFHDTNANGDSITCPSCKEVGYILLSILLWVLSLGFIVFGSRMYLTLAPSGNASGGGRTGKRRAIDVRIRSVARKVIAVMVICSMLFFTRSVFWMYVVGLFLGLFCCLVVVW